MIRCFPWHALVGFEWLPYLCSAKPQKQQNNEKNNWQNERAGKGPVSLIPYY
jgi:hypothetical protein